MSIIEHDFGLELRQATRRFTRLLSLDALHEANVRSNPVPYLERAAERIDRLEAALIDAARTAARPDGAPHATETISVDKADYQRLLNCRAIVEQALAKLASTGDET
jgi:hypothetical protein